MGQMRAGLLGGCAGSVPAGPLAAHRHPPDAAVALHVGAAAGGQPAALQLCAADVVAVAVQAAPHAAPRPPVGFRLQPLPVRLPPGATQLLQPGRDLRGSTVWMCGRDVGLPHASFTPQLTRNSTTYPTDLLGGGSGGKGASGGAAQAAAAGAAPCQRLAGPEFILDFWGRVEGGRRDGMSMQGRQQAGGGERRRRWRRAAS